MSQVNPQEVKDFLKTQESDAATTTPLTPDHEVVNLDDLRKDISAEQEDIAALHQAVEDNRNKTFEPDKASLAHLSSWAFAANNLEVEITDQDKVLYVKSLFNDTPLILDIPLEMGVTFTIRALTNFDLEIIFSTLDTLSKEEKITGPAQYASTVQQCAAAVQIMKIGDKSLDVPEFVSGVTKINDGVEIIKDRISRLFGTWAWPKWQAAVTALRVFETKLTICNENARKANFWPTADAN